MVIGCRASYARSYRLLSPWFHLVASNDRMIVGNGLTVDFWCDNWTGYGPLILRIHETPQSFPKLSKVYVEGQWLFYSCGELTIELMAEISLINVSFYDKLDFMVWTLTSNGIFSVKSALELVSEHGQLDPTATLIWKQKVPPSA